MTTTATATMTTKEIAQRLKKLCEAGEFEKAQKELFSKDAISIEPEASQGFAKETHGLDGILEKGKKWSSMVAESHALEVSNPVVAGNSFAVTMRMDVTMKGQSRMMLDEVAVYKVVDGKIVSEQFFF